MNDDTISRQAAIDELDDGAELLRRALDNADIVGAEREKYEWGLGLIESYISDIKDLPSAERRGRWERRGYHLHCSCCDWSADLATPHCPGCGAYLGGDV